MKHGVSTPRQSSGTAKKISTLLVTSSLSSSLEYAVLVSCLDQARVRGLPVRYEVRRFLLGRFPYAVYIAYLPLELLIVAVAHQHRKPGYWRKRLAKAKRRRK
jgi:hypothetical protein